LQHETVIVMGGLSEVLKGHKFVQQNVVSETTTGTNPLLSLEVLIGHHQNWCYQNCESGTCGSFCLRGSQGTKETTYIKYLVR
jgi:hypothetical protein